MNENVTDLAFKSEFELLSGGDKGNIYQWDLRMRRIVNKYKDKGSVKVSSLAFKNGILAVGSGAGMVNVYNFDGKLQEQSGGEIEP